MQGLGTRVAARLATVGAIAGGAALIMSGSAGAASPRVVSLDQCADQYALALSPRSAIAGLSFRAQAGDSYLAPLASGFPKRRATAESILVSGATVVLRYWGGDQGLVRRLRTRGVSVVTLGEAHDFDGIRANIRTAASALGQVARGEALIAGMDARLSRVAASPGERSALYLTPGGATAGPGTLIDSMLRAGGFANEEQRPGYRMVSPEHLVMHPPGALVLGFFDAFSLGRDWWSPGRGGVFKAAAQTRALARLPGSVLGCPAWFIADGVEALAKASHGA